MTPRGPATSSLLVSWRQAGGNDSIPKGQVLEWGAEVWPGGPVTGFSGEQSWKAWEAELGEHARVSGRMR